MATTFEQVYERALFKITDYSCLTAQQDIQEGVMMRYLMSAITDFQHMCPSVDLSDYDVCEETFNVDLDEEIIEILATGIAFYWMSAKTLNSKLLKNIIHTTDYTSYSPANLLNQMQTLRDTLHTDFLGKARLYSIRYGKSTSLST